MGVAVLIGNGAGHCTNARSTAPRIILIPVMRLTPAAKRRCKLSENTTKHPELRMKQSSLIATPERVEAERLKTWGKIIAQV
jgi:hypothetical protein